VSEPREFNNIAQASVAAFTISIIVNGRRTRALIDSGASGNFCSESLVRRHGLATRTKKDGGYKLQAVNGSALPSVKQETMPVTLDIQQHRERIPLDIVEMAQHDVVLGISWLRYHQPQIDWTNGKLKFEECSCVTTFGPAQRQRSLADEVRQFGQTMRSQPKRGTSEVELTRTDTVKDDPGRSRTDTTPGTEETDHEVTRKTDGSHASASIPEEFKQWASLFQEETGLCLPPHQEWDHEIKLKEGAKIPFQPLYKSSEKELEATRAWIKKMTSKGWLRESKSSAASPCMFVPKPNNGLRQVTDYRRLNEETIKDRYPLPNIEEAQDRLTGANWYTKIDLRDAFYSIRMKEGEEWKTAVRTRYGLYEFLVMPMGLTNAPATMQRMINNVLRDLLDITVIAYLDDILIFTKGSREQHTRDVQEVFKRLSKTTFKTAPEKCEFYKKEVKFLGFIMSQNGIKIDPEKTKSIEEWPTPKNLTEVQSFLGLANYNRKFIKDYSKQATPLTKLTRKDEPFIWGEEQETAFNKLKTAMGTAPMLRMFDTKIPIELETDASDLAIGACLTQRHENRRHPVAYYSRKMTQAEQNYDIHDKELLAIVVALQHWRVYAEGAPEMTIYSDHKNLVTFTTTKELTQRRQIRWAELLGQYKFRIVYTPGKDNGRADALSRRSDYMDKEPVSHSILRMNADGSLSANVLDFNTITQVQRADEEQFPILQGKLQVEPDKVEACVRAHHDDPMAGHPGVARTIELIKRGYNFPRMKEQVKRYISRCTECQTNKASRHKKYGEIQYQEPSTTPWDDVTMDFITKLPKSKDPSTEIVYDSILVMVDKLTKYTHFVPYKETFTAEQLANTVMDRLVRYHGLPRIFLTDRGSVFTSKFWNTLITRLGIKHKLSTAYHPETDGQTERMNQTLEVYLRHYVNYRQDNWVALLPLAQLALNNVRNETTGETPFFSNYGKHPTTFLEPRTGPQAEKGLIQAQNMKKLHEHLRQGIRKMQERTTKAINHKRKNGPQLQKGDKVYLHTKNLKTKRKTKKLDQVKVGPFLIDSQIGPVNYRLQLPEDAKIHPVFHVSLLEPADAETPLQETFHYQSEEENEYEVEEILIWNWDSRTYLVKWKGYDEENNTWEPVQNLENCYQLLARFHRKEEKLHTHPNRPRDVDLDKARPDLVSLQNFRRWLRNH